MWGAAPALFALQSLSVLGRSKNKKSCVLLVFFFSFFGGLKTAWDGFQIINTERRLRRERERDAPRHLFQGVITQSGRGGILEQLLQNHEKKNSCRNMHILAKRSTRRDVANEFQIITET